MESNFAYALKQRRLESKLNQADFGRPCGLSRYQVSDLEKGKQPPTKTVREALEGVYGRLPQSHRLVYDRATQCRWRRLFNRRRRWCQPREVATHIVLLSLREQFPDLYQRYLPWIKKFRAILDKMVFRSSFELALLVQILPAEPIFLKIRPLGWGFDTHPIADLKTGKALNYAFPALGWERDGRFYVLMTQVPLRPSRGAEVDFLIGIHHQGQTRWVIVEVDGPAHLGAGDDARTERLKVPVVRCRHADIVGNGRAVLEDWTFRAAFPEVVAAA